jgi:hypothetical protein
MGKIYIKIHSCAAAPFVVASMGSASVDSAFSPDFLAATFKNAEITYQ